jgi:outer membrane protein OmpA-like peptidoglycan-associated protein
MASPSDNSSDPSATFSANSENNAFGNPSDDAALEDLIELLLGEDQGHFVRPDPPVSASVNTETPLKNQSAPQKSTISADSNQQSSFHPPQQPEKHPPKTPVNSSKPTSSPLPYSNRDLQHQDLQILINKLEAKIARLEHQLYEPTELINPLLPLIRELLSLKSTESSEAILQKFSPLLDEAIRLRSEQAQDKMGEALASVLPTAIAHEIEKSPASIAKALAPEFAQTIREQSKLDPTALAGALGPQMGEAIKQQIVVERDAMVDALYPVIGNTISKYMVEVVKSINEKVESSLSPGGIWRRIRAKIKGISEAELILQESLGFKIRAILLIHKSSGLVIRERLPASDFQVEPSMMAGMLTAIRNFVNDCISAPNEDSELHEIEYDASKIILEVAGYCYLAVVVKGEPNKAFLEKIRETLGQIVLKAERTIAQYNGEPEIVPRTVDVQLDALLEAEPQPEKSKSLSGILIFFGIVLVPTLFWIYRSFIAHQAIARATVALDAAPELSIYRVVPEVHWGTLTLAGRLPNERLRRQAEQVVQPVTPEWPLKNKIVTVQVPAEPTTTAGEIERLIWVYNQKPGTTLKARHDFGSNSVSVSGIAAEQKEVEQLVQALNQVPGVASVTSTVQIRPVLETRLYFEPNVTQLQGTQNTNKLKFIRQFLDENPGVHLDIIGHSDQTGTEQRNQAVSQGRAKTVQQHLISEGVNPGRLTITASRTPPPDLTADQPLWMSRSVRFEVFIPSNKRK